MTSKSFRTHTILLSLLAFSGSAVHGQLDLDQEINLKIQRERSDSEYCESLKRQANYIGRIYTRLPENLGTEYRLVSGNIYALLDCKFKKIGILGDVTTYQPNANGTLSTQFKLKDSDYPVHFGSNQNMLLCYLEKWVPRKQALNQNEADYSSSCLERAVYCDERTGHHGLIAFTGAPYMELKQGICKLQPETF